MATDLRIPLTDDQKRLIVEATSDVPEGMAAWARGILLLAAQKKLRREQRPSSQVEPVCQRGQE